MMSQRGKAFRAVPASSAAEGFGALVLLSIEQPVSEAAQTSPPSRPFARQLRLSSAVYGEAPKSVLEAGAAGIMRRMAEISPRFTRSPNPASLSHLTLAMKLPLGFRGLGKQNLELGFPI